MHGPLIRGALACFAAGVVVFASLGCGSSSSGGLTGDDNTDSGTPADDAAASSSVDAGHDANTTHPGDALACGARVASGVSFTSTGGIYCAPDMPCDLTTHTCCVEGSAPAPACPATAGAAPH